MFNKRTWIVNNGERERERERALKIKNLIDKNIVN